MVRVPVKDIRVIGALGFALGLVRWLKNPVRSHDVVCVSMLKYAAAVSVLACRRRPVPVILRTEGGGPTGDIAWQQRARLGSLVRGACRRADAVVAVSTAIYREAIDAGYDESRVHYVPNAVAIPATPWEHREVRRFRRELGLSDLPTICYTGRFRTGKGLEDLLQALPAVESRLGPTQLLFVGYGALQGTLEQQAVSLGVAERVRFAGQVDDVTPYLRASDLFVLPSYVEGLSLSLLESLALGMPAIASDIEANRDILPERLLPRFPIRSPAALARSIAGRLQEVQVDWSHGAEMRQIINDHYSIETTSRGYIALFRRFIMQRIGDSAGT